MHFGKDFWFILKLLRVILEALSVFSKKENEDTPDGEE